MPLPASVTQGVEWLAKDVGLLRPAEGHGAASLLLAGEDEILLVDAGLTASQLETLAPHVTVCLLSHCHVAHAKGASTFETVWAPRDEARAMTSIDEFLTTYGVARRDRDVVSTSVLRSGFQPAKIAKKVRPGSMIRVGEQEWELLSAAGHSPGLLALHDPVRHFVFAADLDGDGPPWYGWPTSDPTDLERTLTMLAEIPTALYITSHGTPKKRGIKPMLRSQADQIRERDRVLLAALDHPRGLDELADLGLFLGKGTGALHRYHERVMVEKHLGRLLEKDFAHARQDGRFQRLQS